jgi:cellulose synthase/poly-beta-1,6-N-acetylglucosamine synthase-like glycosyltransferase
MAAQFRSGTAMVSGPVLAAAGPDWIGQLQSLELIGLTALGAGSIALGRPNLCNGANLAYLKSAFEAVGGFEGVDHFASGDDELLLQKMVRSRAGEIRFARCRSAIVQTAVQPDWKQLKAQRIRWVSKARHYLHRGVNVTQAVSYLAFWAFPVLAAFSLADARYGVLLAELLLLKAAADLPLMYRSAAFFHKLPLLRMLPLLEVVYIPYVIWVGLAGNLARSYDWKGRMVQ